MGDNAGHVIFEDERIRFVLRNSNELNYALKLIEAWY
jgi:hypothetical protein